MNSISDEKGLHELGVPCGPPMYPPDLPPPPIYAPDLPPDVPPLIEDYGVLHELGVAKTSVRSGLGVRFRRF